MKYGMFHAWLMDKDPHLYLKKILFQSWTPQDRKNYIS